MLLVRLADHRVGVPLEAVERVLPMAAILPLPEMGQQVIGVLNVHGEILPVVDPRPRLGLATPALNPDQRLALIDGRDRFLLWLDAIDDVVPSADALATLPADQATPLVPRVIRVGDDLVPILAPAALAPRAGAGR